MGDAMDVLQNTLIFLFSFMFLSAGMSKLRHQDYSQQALEAYQLAPKFLTGFLSRSLASAELLLVPALILPLSQSMAVYAAVLLLLVYAMAIAINLLRGRKRLDCGCNGPDSKQSISWWMVLRNLFMAMVLLMLPIQTVLAPLSVYVLALFFSAALILIRQGAQLLYKNQQLMSRQGQ